MIGFRCFCVLVKWWGRVHQPPLFITPSILYWSNLARMFDLFFFLSMNFACMLGPCAPKKAPFCKNLFLYHLPSFFSSVIKEQPILFVRKWAQWCVRPPFFAMLKKSEAFISLFFLPRRWVVLESQADRDKWPGCQVWDLTKHTRIIYMDVIFSCSHSFCRLRPFIL